MKGLGSRWLSAMEALLEECSYCWFAVFQMCVIAIHHLTSQRCEYQCKVPEQLRWVLTSVLLHYLPSFQIMSKELLFGFVIMLNFFYVYYSFSVCSFLICFVHKLFFSFVWLPFEFHEKLWLSYANKKIFQFMFSFSNFSTKNPLFIDVPNLSMPATTTFQAFIILHLNHWTWPPGQSPNTGLSFLQALILQVHCSY